MRLSPCCNAPTTNHHISNHFWSPNLYTCTKCRKMHDLDHKIKTEPSLVSRIRSTFSAFQMHFAFTNARHFHQHRGLTGEKSGNCDACHKRGATNTINSKLVHAKQSCMNRASIRIPLWVKLTAPLLTMLILMAVGLPEAKWFLFAVGLTAKASEDAPSRFSRRGIVTVLASIPVVVIAALSGTRRAEAVTFYTYSPVSEANCVVFADGTTTRAINGATGVVISSSTDEYTVIAAAIASLTSGGRIHLKGPTTYTLTDELLFNQGNYDTKEWIISGDGMTTLIDQSTANKSAFIIKNGTRIQIRDLQINVGVNANYAIYGDNTGTDDISIRRGRLSNLYMHGGSAGKNILYLKNPFQSMIDHVRVASLVCVPVKIETDSTVVGGVGNAGNCEFVEMHVYTEGFNGVQMVGTNNLINLNHFTMLIILNMGASAGTTGITLGQDVCYNQFDFVDIEGFDNAIVVNGTNLHPPSSNKFSGGLIADTDTLGINTGQFSQDNKFSGIRIFLNTPAGKTAILDAAAGGYLPNIYEDCVYNQTAIITKGNARFRGVATPALAYYSNSGISTQNGTGAATAFTIPHGLVAAPRYYNVQKGAASLPGLEHIGADATNITATFAAAPDVGVNNVVLIWEAEI